MWYHLSFSLMVAATQLLHMAFTSYGPCHRGVNALCFTKTRIITMSPSVNLFSAVGLNWASLFKSDCCFNVARAYNPLRRSCSCNSTVCCFATVRGPRSSGEISGSTGSFITLPVMSSCGLIPVAFDGVARKTVKTVGNASVHWFLCWAICFAMCSLILRFTRSTRTLWSVGNVESLFDV